jgi:hypothetical protein
MPDFFYRAIDAAGERSYFRVRVEPQEDHWVATCEPVDERGHELAAEGPVAPRFYGVHAEQARRRMVSALENQYEDVTGFQPSRS